MNQHFALETLKEDIVDKNLHLKAIIQDIYSFHGSLSELEILNENGRLKLFELRKCIECLDNFSKNKIKVDVGEIDFQREQFERTVQSFRKANIATMLHIKKSNRDELFFQCSSDICQRKDVSKNKSNRSGLIAQQDNITDKMLSITGHLSETTQKSATTLDSLVLSSQTVEGTRNELHNTAGAIVKSGKLLKKYGRRECTDKILLLFAFIFFLFVVFYIVHKRIF